MRRILILVPINGVGIFETTVNGLFSFSWLAVKQSVIWTNRSEEIVRDSCTTKRKEKWKTEKKKDTSASQARHARIARHYTESLWFWFKTDRKHLSEKKLQSKSQPIFFLILTRFLLRKGLQKHSVTLSLCSTLSMPSYVINHKVQIFFRSQPNTTLLIPA